jgi:hypothetical protein
MNSLKSACSFARTTPVPFDQFEKHVEPFPKRQVGVELIVSSACILETAEYPDFSIYAATSTCADPRAGVSRGSRRG